MSTFRIASLIRRFLLHKSESKDEQTTPATSDEDIQLAILPSKEGHEGNEQPHFFYNNELDVSVSDAGDYSSLLSESEHLLGEFFLGEDSQAFFTEDATWDFIESSMGDFPLSLGVVAQSDLFDCFVEQVVSSLSQHLPLYSVSEPSIDIESYKLNSVPQNHYHPDSDPSSFSLPDLFSQSTENVFVEVSHEPDFESVQRSEVVPRADIVEEVLSGEVLATDNDASIYFYDGEPIEIGAPIVLDPAGRVLSGDPTGDVGRPVQVLPVTGHVIALKDECEQDAMLSIDAGRADVDLILDLAKYHPGDLILINKFELGRDTLSIRTLLGTETTETLGDNAPTDCVGKEGEAMLGFSVERGEGEECTVAFVGLTHEDYMEFLSTAMHRVTEC